MSAALIIAALRDPATALALSADQLNQLWAAARAERLAGTLGHRLAGLALPENFVRLLGEARMLAEHDRRLGLWEAEMARRTLAPLGVPVILLKGTAYLAAGLKAGQGRMVGDLDILVPRADLPQVEQALLGADWEWVKDDPYDQHYYRRWMHELPPLIHRARDRMIDVHHTILPLTARPTPDAAALVAGRVELDNGLAILSPEDMIVHAAAHLFADGDLSGGLRNLWDIHCLLDEFAEIDGFDARLQAQAELHQLAPVVVRAVRLAGYLFTHPDQRQTKITLTDRLYLRRLTARDGWGRATRPFTRFAFYLRSHWLRMPPFMLARHLWVKWRKTA
jgi:hypothetical protein